MEMGIAQEGTAGRKYVSIKKEISRYPGKSTGDRDLGLHNAVLTVRTNSKNVQHLPLTTSWRERKLTDFSTNRMLSVTQPYFGCGECSQRAWPRHPIHTAGKDSHGRKSEMLSNDASGWKNEKGKSQRFQQSVIALLCVFGKGEVNCYQAEDGFVCLQHNRYPLWKTGNNSSKKVKLIHNLIA